VSKCSGLFVRKTTDGKNSRRSRVVWHANQGCPHAPQLMKCDAAGGLECPCPTEPRYPSKDGERSSPKHSTAGSHRPVTLRSERTTARSRSQDGPGPAYPPPRSIGMSAYAPFRRETKGDLVTTSQGPIETCGESKQYRRRTDDLGVRAGRGSRSSANRGDRFIFLTDRPYGYQQTPMLGSVHPANHSGFP